MPEGTVTSSDSECELDGLQGALMFMCILVFCAMHVLKCVCMYVCMYVAPKEFSIAKYGQTRIHASESTDKRHGEYTNELLM